MGRVKSYYVGDGDMFYIDHNSDNFTIIDCCYTDDDNKKVNFDELESLSDAKGITRFISTHPDEDHIKGLEDLDDRIGILNFYVVKNEAIKKDEETDSFKRYCKLRDDEKKAFYIYQDCKRNWMNQTTEERGSSGINILWPWTPSEDFQDALEKVKKGEDFNNISPIITYSGGGATFMWMGDMESDFQEKIKDYVEWPDVDVLFAPHHGRDSGKVPEDVLKDMNPKIIVIGSAPSGYLNYYSGYNTIKQNSAKDIIFDCVDGKVNIYVSAEGYVDSYPISDLAWDRTAAGKDLGYYLGSFTPYGAEE